MLKIKFIFFYIGLILLSSITIINCSDDNIVTPLPVDSSDFRYPFKDGSTWNYTITISASDIRPDSILHYFTDYPFVTTGTATILYDTVINSIVTKCFLDEFVSNGIIRYNRYYYVNNDTAMILYARRQQGPASGILPLRKTNNVLNGTDDNNVNNLYNNEFEILNDSLYSTLKYPIVTGTEWSYTPTPGFTISKKYLGFENIAVPAGTISCMKENVVYSYEPTWLYDYYYSRFGLIKAYSFFNDITFIPIEGTYDLTGETVVTSFNIPSE
ncbi:MAG: hypothetical protein M3R36_06320 [Bacteroidota bacterium]|nr:hypothetical protein [Bacteroidota bacterium]